MRMASSLPWGAAPRRTLSASRAIKRSSPGTRTPGAERTPHLGPPRAGRPRVRARTARSAPGAEVRALLVGQGVDLHPERRQLEPRDLAIDRLGDRVDARAEHPGTAREVL